MKKYLYESHLGGLYVSDEIRDFADLFCEQCGDSDQLIGTFNTAKEFWDLVKDECDINGSGGYALQYIYPLMVEEFELMDNTVYENKYEKESGFCCNSEGEILKFIKEAI